jgi:pimeloyl-ACP methyl ester carboxylesterase
LLAYEEQGSGDPLVLVHGLATTRVIWRRVLPLLADARRVIAVDVPGFGATPAAGDGFELDVVADALHAGLPVGRYDLVGHSLGGAIAITLAHRHPEAVGRLVLVAPAGFRQVPAPAALVAGFAAARAIPLRRHAARSPTSSGAGSC